jgi:Ca2+-binding RTX toxin-like protein
MATIKWLDANAEGFGGELVLGVNDRHTKAVYELGGGAEIVLTGRNLRAEDGVLRSGTISTVTFENNTGNAILTVDGKFKGSKLGEVAANGDPSDILRALCQGDDKVVGTSEADFLVGLRGDDVLRGNRGTDTMTGGLGDDVLIGGAGSDMFVFEVNDVGRDIIRDFDAIGDSTDSLRIDSDITSIRSVHRGHDTVIELENGGSILLENVTTKQFDEFWFDIS